MFKKNLDLTVTFKASNLLLVNTGNLCDQLVNSAWVNLLPSRKISDHKDSYWNDWILSTNLLNNDKCGRTFTQFTCEEVSQS